MSHDSLEPGVIIKLRRDTAENWTTDNPVLAVGETGWETDSRRVKLGDGVTAWMDLPYAADEAASVEAETDARIEADEALQEQIDATDLSLATEATTRGDADTALDGRIDSIETELDTWVPGTELGNAERTTSATTTATSLGAATAISGLSVTVLGKGRPVDVEFYCAGAWHSVAATFLLAAIDASGTSIQTGTTSSTATNNGRSFNVKRRLVLTDGVSYTFTVKPFGLAAGTTTIYAAATQPMSLSVVTR